MPDSKSDKNKFGYDITQYFDMGIDDIALEELQYAYPIQADLESITKRYTDKKLIGEGGMKHIYQVYDNYAGRSVAMAVLKKEANAELIESFLCEARLTSLLEHPNIISIYDIGKNEEGLHYFTMELLQGENLKEIIDKLKAEDPEYISAYTETEKLNIFTSICDAISYAHSKGVLHLDIKPENIQVGKFGEVTVCDWGLGKLITDDRDGVSLEESSPDPNIINDMTIAGFIKGTPGFMAPEQCKEEQDKGESTDIYSLGALLYNLLTLEKCVTGKSHHEIIQKTIDGNIRTMDSTTNPRLQATIYKAISTKPEDRYTSAIHLKKDISNYLHGYATEAEGASFLTQFVLLVKRNKNISGIILISTMSLIILSGIYIHNLSQSRNEAISEKKRAQMAESVSLDSLEKLKKEIEVNESLNQELSKVILQIANDNDFSYPMAKINIMEYGLKQNTGLDETQAMLKKKAMLYFITQQFDKSYITFSQVNKMMRRERRIMELSEKYKSYKGDNELLSSDHLSEIIFDLGVYHRSIASSLYMHHLGTRKPQKKNIEGDYKLFQSMVFCINKLNIYQLKSRKLISSDKSYSIDLSNLPIDTLKLPYSYKFTNLLQDFKIETLNLSNTNIADLGFLYNSSIKKLNITNTLSRNFNKPLINNLKKNGLIEVTLTKDKFQTETIEMLKEHFKVNLM